MDDNHINLAEDLTEQFANKELTAANLIDLHHPTTLYAPTHYVKALRLLVDQGRLESTFNDGIDHKVSVLLSVNCILKFPPFNG